MPKDRPQFQLMNFGITLHPDDDITRWDEAVEGAVARAGCEMLFKGFAGATRQYWYVSNDFLAMNEVILNLRKMGIVCHREIYSTVTELHVTNGEWLHALLYEGVEDQSPLDPALERTRDHTAEG